MKNRSFFEVIADSVSSFMSSFFGLIATWWFAIAIIAGVVFAAVKFFGVSPNQIQALTNTPNKNAISIAIAIASQYFYLIFIMWQINVISNKISFGENRLFISLFRSILKSFKVIAGTLIMIILTSIVLLPIVFILPKYVSSKVMASIIIFIIELLIAPYIFCAFMGLTLQDGKFLKIFGQSFKIAGHSYFTLIFNLIYLVMCSLMFAGVSFLLVIIFKIFGIIMTIILMSLFFSYTLCYSVEAYFNCLDRYEIKEEGPLAQVETFKLEEQQKIYMSTIPEGMKPLGSNYQENQNSQNNKNNLNQQNSPENKDKPLAK